MVRKHAQVAGFDWEYLEGGEAHADDYEEFLHDIEWDAQARSNVDLYKDPAMWRIAQVSRCRPLLLPRQASFASLS